MPALPWSMPGSKPTARRRPPPEHGRALSSRTPRNLSFGVLDQDVVGFDQEKAMADHAGQTVEACAQPHEIETGGERRIDHRIAVVGLVGRSVGFQSDGSLESDGAQALSD